MHPFIAVLCYPSFSIIINSIFVLLQTLRRLSTNLLKTEIFDPIRIIKVQTTVEVSELAELFQATNFTYGS